MKYRLLSILFCIFVLIGCSKNEPKESDNEPVETYDDFKFYVDSIKNITSSSATVKATLTLLKLGTVNISGLYLEITLGPTNDSLYREVDFDKKQGIVELTITDLKPNTVYYIEPTARFNPPYIDQYATRITGLGSPYSTVTFTTLPK